MLRWGDVDWDRNRIRIRSPKTEHIEGKDSRTIPIFPELRTYLEQAWDAPGEGTEFLITRYRSATANLRTQLERIIHKAGLEPWPKLFQNLRATRETELAQSFPIHVVCNWIGNSQRVGAKHYLQVTDEHLRDAVGSTGNAAQNQAQQNGVGNGGDSHSSTDSHKKTPETPGNASCGDMLQICTVTPTGIEPVLPA